MGSFARATGIYASLIPRLHSPAFYCTVYKSGAIKKLGSGVWERGYKYAIHVVISRVANGGVAVGTSMIVIVLEGGREFASDRKAQVATIMNLKVDLREDYFVLVSVINKDIRVHYQQYYAPTYVLLHSTTCKCTVGPVLIA